MIPSTPIQYFAIRNDGLEAAPDDLTGKRLRTSAFLVQRNRDKPVLVSYGPDGPEQWSNELREFSDIPGVGLTDVVTDFTQTTPVEEAIDNPFNDDNVYVDESLKDRLRKLD